MRDGSCEAMDNTDVREIERLQMIDASIVQAPRQALNKEEKAIVSEGAMPADWKPAKRRQKDMDARWTKKHDKCGACQQRCY